MRRSVATSYKCAMFSAQPSLRLHTIAFRYVDEFFSLFRSDFILEFWTG